MKLNARTCCHSMLLDATFRLLHLYVDQILLGLGSFFICIMLQDSKMQKTATELYGALSALKSSGSV
jgi:hypothetical protein